MPIYRLENVVQPYEWGSRTAIADLLGQPSPAPGPQAEMWMGTHPKGPSKVVAGDQKIPLQQLIDRQSVGILGRDVCMRYGNALPYLFKVLAAARPLSIQAHPSKRQAVEGFSRENREGKAVDAPDRNYRDDNHKPEIICALTPFWGLNGFRPAAAAVDLLTPVCPTALNNAFQDLKRRQGKGLRNFFEAMMTLSAEKRKAAAREVLDKAGPVADASPLYQWMVNLARAYPADMGILSPALLNLICLKPGQAMFLPAGQLHAYLDGVGIELMANSDNVLRGGLTPKHVDASELLSVVRFEETSIKILEPFPMGSAESVYDCPAEEFSLTVIRPSNGQPYHSPSIRNVEMLLCTAGEGHIEYNDRRERLTVKKGDSFLVPAGLHAYVIGGSLTVYKAAVPLLRPSSKAS
ncbi:mannose-6-phosphate isomerase, class I [uncultured Desulfosarcina sp.]|uniref:mannose-6-phosphate isomerase, class I n=1 Tax=uncultured Desulfosarcina sp. TaxID=218289 RepID=UPI0029C7AD3F|nr:mannose-6-phosphate isomerase, class I [uncultured Desulfosarcina sp.]